ncbi:PREDICTED: uncharacterized protein LOC104826487 [Tarenaya hassleriana]|uniref:uncharacterized protein LOC104826487 n=1 Tax=Tarenaya hassleriana TaxID=28532 RepID=UPI00053C4B31|nr:PREDICTED: uncharacterized protein LOC104826487 [Tarenaya hassleriana]
MVCDQQSHCSPNKKTMGGRVVITMLMIAAVFLCSHKAEAQVCGADLMGLISECQRYVGKSGPKIPPSPSCCALIRPIDVPCACRYISRDVMSYVDMDKVVYVARSCGKKIASGYKCGSYTVPAP